ncbi:HAMP domain-containing histidine kinase [Clostridium bornimense]|uniref:sensor histidine kinase n=1 Tax=Clostridium bornimense TaxID=1216932 RepID=UPI001C123531|nr:HAMP domain-containing sensor histidine kinase [Clostridium bornimense]MBU5316688.1 HAMP domain-containing histidine kinase [Clostridium bornimense]
MKHIKYICFYIILSICILDIFPISVYAVNNKKESKEVLVVYSDSENLSYVNSILLNVKKHVEDYGLNLTYDTEKIPISYIMNSSDIDTYTSIIERKCENKSYDAIIAMGEDAFKFISEHKVKALNDIPMVINGMNSLEYQNSSSDFSGVLTDVNFKTLINAIKTVQPTIKEIYFYGADSTLTEEKISKISKQCTNEGIKMLTIPIEDFRNYKFKNKGNNEALIVCDKNLDNYGNILENDEFFNYIRNVYTGPTYVYNPNQLNVSKYSLNDKTKFVGGVVFNTEENSKVIYEKLLKIFTKTRTKNRDVTEIDGKIELDYSAIDEYNLNSKSLPKSFEIIGNKDTTLDKIVDKTPEIIIIVCIAITMAILLFHYIRSKNRKLSINLSKSEKRYEELLKLLPDPVIVVSNNKISYINDYGINYLKARDVIEVIGMDINDIVYKEVTFNPLKGIHTTVKTEIILLNKEVRDVELSYTLDSNFSKGVIMVIRDLTDEKLLVKRKEFDKLRSEFFANISHELRTPINIILSTTQLLQLLCNDKGEKFASYLESLKQNAYRLTKLTNNLIDSTKIDAGYMNLNLKPCNIVEVTEEVTLSTINFAKEKGITVTFDTDEEEVYTMVDFEKYERIILNLLSNAIKYNRENGTITVTMSTKENTVEVAVKDSGIGIPANEISSVFERFVQTAGVSSSNVQGSGIGLSLVKSLVEMHKGRISVSSVEGEYTEFVVSIPLIEDINIEESIETIDHNDFNANKMALVELSDLDK